MLLHRRAVDNPCSFTRWQYFYVWSDVMTAILKVWRKIENLSASIDAYLHSCQILSPTIYDRMNRAVGFFEDVTPTRKRKARWLAIWEKILVKKTGNMMRQIGRLMKVKQPYGKTDKLQICIYIILPNFRGLSLFIFLPPFWLRWVPVHLTQCIS